MSAYRDHEIVEVTWLEISGLDLVPVSRFIVKEHADALCDRQVSVPHLTERGAQREINQCLEPTPPRTHEQMLVEAMAAGLAVWRGHPVAPALAPEPAVYTRYKR